MSSSLMGSHGGLALATAMAVSGTVFLIALCRQKTAQFAATSAQFAAVIQNSQTPLRSCISSDERKRERAKKTVRFAENVVVEFETDSCDDDEEDEEELEEEEEIHGQVNGGGIMPANRAALYNGILQYRLQRMACSY